MFWLIAYSVVSGIAFLQVTEDQKLDYNAFYAVVLSLLWPLWLWAALVL